MNLATRTRDIHFAPTAPSGFVRRIGSLARAEALLLRRNPMALINALAIPVAMVVFLVTVEAGDSAGGSGKGPAVVTTLTAVSLLAVVYMGLVTALVARREELVLKRLRTGELYDAEIIAGTAAPAVAVAWGQMLVGVLAAFTVFGMGLPTNPVLVLVAIVLGTAVFVLFAVVTTAVTRTVEMAQVTATPGYAVPVLFSGLLFPLDLLPEPLQRVAPLMPMTPVVDLMHLGLTGRTPDGDTVGLGASFAPSAGPVLVLVAWVVVAGWAARRWFRWEPRR
jgi:ABC-2 type transport system permease protein